MQRPFKYSSPKINKAYTTQNHSNLNYAIILQWPTFDFFSFENNGQQGPIGRSVMPKGPKAE